MDDDTRDFLNLVAFDNLNDLAAELRAIADEMDSGSAKTKPPLHLLWSERIRAVAARLEE